MTEQTEQQKTNHHPNVPIEGRGCRLGCSLIGTLIGVIVALSANFFAYLLFLGKSVAASSHYSQEFLGGLLNIFGVLALLFLLGTAVFTGFISYKVGKRMDASRAN